MSSPILGLLFAVVNAAGIPGVGTVLAGRKKIGYIQIGFSLSFLLLSAVPLLLMALEMVSRGMSVRRFLDLLLLRDTWIFTERETALFLFALCGVMAYLANLAWSLTTTRPLPIPPRRPPPLPDR